MSHAETALACQVSYQVKEVREEKAKLTQIISESRNHALAFPVLLYLEVASDCPCSTQRLRDSDRKIKAPEHHLSRSQRAHSHVEAY